MYEVNWLPFSTCIDFQSINICLQNFFAQLSLCMAILRSWWATLTVIMNIKTNNAQKEHLVSIDYDCMASGIALWYLHQEVLNIYVFMCSNLPTWCRFGDNRFDRDDDERDSDDLCYCLEVYFLWHVNIHTRITCFLISFWCANGWETPFDPDP